jgi:hypothetical protein
MEFANIIRRRNNQGPPDEGGYHMFCTLIDRSLPNVHPLGNLAIRADGKEPINGWANSPRIEELRAAWLDTADLEQQKRICVDLQKQLWEDVPFIPMGEYWQATAYRKDFDRRSARMFRRLLWRAPRLNECQLAQEGICAILNPPLFQCGQRPLTAPSGLYPAQARRKARRPMRDATPGQWDNSIALV